MPLTVSFVPKFDKTLFCTSFKCSPNCTPLNRQKEIKFKVSLLYSLDTTIIVSTKLFYLFCIYKFNFVFNKSSQKVLEVRVAKY